MAVKGSILKQEITKKILATFPGSFLYNDGKEIRIDGVEQGLRTQIKITLTCAKEPVDNEDAEGATFTSDEMPVPQVSKNEKVPDEPTEEEKARLKKLLEGLGL